MTANRNELAANNIDGVYNCENPSIQDQRNGLDVLVDGDFYSALASCPDGKTIYGDVSDEWAERIDEEYGIH
jgi:hypothetical protein